MSRPVIERLETRQLLSASAFSASASLGPQVTGEQLIGPANAVTGIRLTFDKPLNAATAQDVDAYVIFRTINNSGSDGGFFDSFVPFYDSSTGSSSKVKKLRLDSAVYDPATLSVTITPHHPFRGDKLFKRIRIIGHGNHGILGADGSALDGNGNGQVGDNAFIRFRTRRGRHLAFTDADGDRGVLRLSGPGKLVSLTHRHGAGAPLVFLSNTVAGQSTLTGTVKQSRHGDGVVQINELSGISTATVTLLNDPAFQIQMTQP